MDEKTFVEFTLSTRLRSLYHITLIAIWIILFSETMAFSSDEPIEGPPLSNNLSSSNQTSKSNGNSTSDESQTNQSGVVANRSDKDALLDGPPLSEIPSWAEALRSVLLTAIPDKYEDTKHWGKTRNVIGGVKLNQKNGALRVSKRKKTVNHGNWYKYRIELLDPQKNLSLALNQWTLNGPGDYSFQLVLTTRIRCHAKYEQWMLGIRGLSFPLETDVVVLMKAKCQLTMTTERQPKSFLPDIVLKPVVKTVELRIKDLSTRRIGELRGNLADELGNGLKPIIEDRLQKQESKVVKKANQAIEKKQSDLRVPVSQLW